MIVAGIPTQSTLTFWVHARLASNPTAKLDGSNNVLTKKNILLPDGSILAYLFTASNLIAKTEYTFVLFASDGNVVATKKSRTLPTSLEISESFTLALGSCYWYPSKGRTLLPEYWPPKANDTPDLTLLVGDQVYIDVSGSSGIPDMISAPNPFEIYHRQWTDESFEQFFSAIPVGVLADDHEFWNDYPHNDIYLEYLYVSSAREKLAADATAAFNAYQLPLNIRQEASCEFSIPPLNFFIADTRLQRTRYDSNNPTFFGADGTLKKRVTNWLQKLDGPGVFVMGDVIVDEAHSWLTRALHTMGDVSLADYGDDFYDLWNALASCSHDVLVLAGDVHYGRFGYVDVRNWRFFPKTANRIGRVYECVSSAICLLSSAQSEYEEIKMFDASGVLGNDLRLEYKNIYAMGKGVENYAILRFTRINDGIEFYVHYYEVGRPSAEFKTETLMKCVLY